jgi:polar amino acid transport system substrate-binding protein
MLILLAWRHFQTPTIAHRTLRWGGDKGGGAPFVYEDHGQLKGFEVDLAAYLANRLGLPSEFVQKEWNSLPSDLERGDIDLILNGYEWTPRKERAMASTIPYYVYRLQLVVGPNSSIKSWQDLRGKRVGVLSESAAQRYLEKEFGSGVTIVALGEEGSTGILSLVREGKKLDATVQDLVTIIYYVLQDHGFGDLHVVGEPIAPGYYVAFVRRQDTELRNRLNETIRQALHDGTLKAIYEKHGLWNEDQKDLEKLAVDWPPPATDAEPALLEFGWLLTQSAGTTIVLACLSMPLAMLIGLLVAVGRLYGPRWLDWLLGAYVELLRGTPLLLQLFVIYYLLPKIHIDLPAFWAGIAGLAINYSAYEAENYRAGLLAIPRGQMEAALALGMSTLTALRRVIIPQAVRIVIPPVTNDFIALFKDTSVCSVIAVVELTGRYRGLAVNNPEYVLHLGLMTAILYLLMSYPLSLLARRLERRYPRVIV